MEMLRSWMSSLSSEKSRDDKSDTEKDGAQGTGTTMTLGVSRLSGQTAGQLTPLCRRRTVIPVV